MYKEKKVANRISILVMTILACAFSLNIYKVNAAGINYPVAGISYELTDSSGFKPSGKEQEILCFGEKSIGTFGVQGNIKKQSTYDGYVAFGTVDELILGYNYDGSYQTKNKEAWNLTSSNEKKINDITIDKKIGKGAIIVENSLNGKEWALVHSITDIFDKDKKAMDAFYNISIDDAKKGTYYRVSVAYRMAQKVAVDKNWIFKSDVFQYKEFVEVYEFYVCYGGNAVEIRDISTGEKAESLVSKGFIIDKSGTNCSVTVSKNNGVESKVDSLSSIIDPGNYKIKITNSLNQSFEKWVTVSDGMELEQTLPTVYEGGKKGKYIEENAVVGLTSFDMYSMSKLKIGYQNDSRITKSSKNGYDAYGVTGNSVSLYLQLAEASELKAKGWEIYADKYGKKEKETIKDVRTGEIATGALIIQKSANGTEWENIDQGRYSNGLYTTDFYNHYGDKGDIYIYSPDGNELLNGLYLRVIFAYELKEIESKTYNRCLEIYEFYLCSSELGAVTFHNLTVTDEKIEEIVGEDNVDLLEVYKSSESLVSGSGTVTGFSVDTSQNPTVTYTVKRNGCDVAIPSNHEFTADGKYDIFLKSAVGDTDKVTIYVDKSSADVALQRYFGTGFVTGKRIFREGNYPTFEGGKSQYFISEVSEDYLPIGGTIKNITTGDIINISSTQKEVFGELTIPGNYIATLSTMPMKAGEALPGDMRVFTFSFSIIPEGEAPGPVVNYDRLNEYAKSTMTDSYPMYYGLTYESAKGGKITLAFASKEAAKQYAYDYEKGTVEEQSDGTFRYTGSFLMTQKIKYMSAWDLTDAMNRFAEQAVQTLFFDMSDPFTYVTLDSAFANVKNPRKYELNDSVVLFADGEKEKLCEKISALPIISRKPCLYLTPGEKGSVREDYVDFMFTKDKYGVDSNEVIITDCNGKVYEIEYQVGVGLQLMQQGCPSGVVTITESTFYGDKKTYEAVFIAENDNTSSVEIEYYEGKEEKSAVFTQKDNGKTIEVDAFKISKLIDDLDPYSIVTIENMENVEKTICYVADQEATHVWTEPALYKISVSNRLGYSYSINVKIVESEYVTLAFVGEETDGIDAILTCYGEKNIELPELTRYGYELIGFEAEDGTIYTDVISNISFKGENVLNAKWKAKEYLVTLQDVNGNVYKTISAEFGKSYELETFETSEGIEISGWLKDGNLVQNNKITIDEEADIVLTAAIRDEYGKNVAVAENVEKTGSRSWILIVIVTIVLTSYIINKKLLPEKNNVVLREGKTEDEKNE